MAQTLTRSEERISTPHVLLTPRFSKLLLVAGILAIIVGLGSMAGGVVGAIFTWDQAVTQNVTTPDDASIPETAVRGPFTMLSQAAIITEHQLENTEGLYYAEMPREVPQVDENGAAVLDENGDPVMGAQRGPGLLAQRHDPDDGAVGRCHGLRTGCVRFRGRAGDGGQRGGVPRTADSREDHRLSGDFPVPPTTAGPRRREAPG